MNNCKLNKKLLLLFIVGFVCIASMFAEAATTTKTNEINDAVFKIVDFFSSGWVKGIACIALIAECIGLLVGGGQNPQILKKFLPLIAGTIIFMCAGKIVSLLFGKNPNFKSDLEKESALLENNVNTDSYNIIDENNIVFFG